MSKERTITEGCQGWLSTGGTCSSRYLDLYEKVAESFGQQFTTRAYMCPSHANLLGFQLAKDQPEPAPAAPALRAVR